MPDCFLPIINGLGFFRRTISCQFSDNGCCGGRILALIQAPGCARARANQISRPIVLLADASRAVAAGEIDKRVVIDANNEIEAGMNDYISKPVDPVKLRRALEQWLPLDCRCGTARFRTLQEIPELPISAAETGTAAAAKNPEAAVFDNDAMHKRLMGDTALMRTVAEAFIGDMQEQIAALKAAATAGDVQQTAAQAHKIKGAAANVGGMVLSTQALELEQASKAGKLQAIRHEVPQLENPSRNSGRQWRRHCFEATHSG